VKTGERARLIELLRKMIYDLTGNFYPDERMKILEYKLERLLKSLNLNGLSPEEIISYFMNNSERRKILIDLMTVPETRFFREREQLEVLFDRVLRGKGSLNLASVGCSAGQEPYTLAMMMAKRGMVGRVIGIDINVKILERAREGRYRKEELRDIPEEYRDLVILEGDFVNVSPKVRRMVEFVEGNLIDPKSFEPFKGGFDVVLCRNVLIYFDRRSKEVALENLRNSMKKDGILVLSSTEILGKEFYYLFEPFKEGRFTFYRRKEG